MLRTDATSLTFNVDSAHQFLRLTVGNRRMTNTTPWQHCYPEHPERFEHWRQAFACESLFLGRHYFEVDLSGEGAYMGLTCKSIKRKSVEYSSCITGNTFSWSLGRSSHGLSCWHAGEERCLQGEPLNRVGVYVDYQAGVVAFYGVTGTMTLLHEQGRTGHRGYRGNPRWADGVRAGPIFSRQSKLGAWQWRLVIHPDNFTVSRQNMCAGVGGVAAITNMKKNCATAPGPLFFPSPPLGGILGLVRLDFLLL